MEATIVSFGLYREYGFAYIKYWIDIGILKKQMETTI